jgi:acyl carrier protein
MDTEVFMSAMADALGVDRAELSEATDLNDENWDSLAHIATISAIDEKFGVTVPANELTRVRTLGELMALVERSLAAHSSQG